MNLIESILEVGYHKAKKNFQRMLFIIEKGYKPDRGFSVKNEGETLPLEAA